MHFVQDATPEGRFAAHVRQAREARQMSQAALAELLQAHHGIRLDPTGITRLERGNRLIRLNEAVALADILGIRLFDVLRPRWFRRLPPGALREEASRLLAELDALDAEIARADRASMAARTEAGELREQRSDVQMSLAGILADPDLSQEQATALRNRLGTDPDPAWLLESRGDENGTG